MQARVWDKVDAQHLLVKSPPASGKSRAAMFVGLEKLRTSEVKKVLVAVPERSIGASFRDTELKKHGFHSDWKLDLDLCTVGSETGRGLSPKFLPATSRALGRFDAHVWA
ncbi:hypothetical protein EB810_15175 [Altererythrobacter sp. FM1]|uniref:DEAD/DEAH box helicase family protein n=1 Tax=Tsuneonella flava TaxID=2055955 RepID=UPI000F4D0491|nr:DEAD/DEAH box helicase family protein [Tsuneonella flava]ROT93425.1 hypothetical protein EB810_15175 [Altererythrobacter sp. FM1]